MSSRKDYVATAKIIKEVKSPKERARLTVKFINVFSKDNKNFNAYKFKKACGFSFNVKSKYSEIVNKKRPSYTIGWFRDFILLKDIK